MPVASVDEDGDTMPSEYDVCATVDRRKRPVVDAVTESARMEESSDGQLRFRVS